MGCKTQDILYLDSGIREIRRTGWTTRSMTILVIITGSPTCKDYIRITLQETLELQVLPDPELKGVEKLSALCSVKG